MKKISLVLLLLLLCGCQNKVAEYKEVSDIVVELLKNEQYDISNLNDTQIKLIENYELNLNNPEINIDDYIVYNDSYKTEEENTLGTYKKNDSCYIRYDDIGFSESLDHNGEPMAKVVCNGYYAVIYHDSVKPLNSSYDNEVYNYRYLGYYKDNGYNFAYRSYYDGSGLIVKINDEIKTEFTDVDSLDLKTIKKTSPTKYIFPSIMIIAITGLIVYLNKKDKV